VEKTAATKRVSKDGSSSRTAPTTRPRVRAGLQTVARLARRQASVTEAIGTGLARNLVVQTAQRQPPLAAMLTMVPSYA